MRRDTRVFVAVLVLIVLVGVLIGVSLRRTDDDRRQLNQALETIRTIQEKVESLPAQSSPDVPAADYRGSTGPAGRDGKPGAQGSDGDSGKAGATGAQGTAGRDGVDGQHGDSAYDVAVKEGFRGSVKDWLDSLKVKGDAAPALKLDCISGLLMKQYEGDSLWEPTKIRCEVVHE